MDELKRQVSRAQRRLTLQRFLGVLGWCWSAALLAALVLILIDKFHPLGVSAAIWFAGALGAGPLAAGAWTWLTRQKPIEAAMEIDRRFALKERVSSAWVLPTEQRETEAGQAVTADATRRVARLELTERFTIRPPRQLLFPLAPALVALLVAWLVSPAGAENTVKEKEQNLISRPAVKKAAETVKKQLAQSRKRAKKEGLPDAEQFFKKLEEGTRDSTNKPLEKKKALTKLNDLSRQLQDRRRQLGGAEKLRERLDALKKLDRGPAEKFAKALSKGNMRKALNELKKLQEALEKGDLSDKQKEELAQQMKQMQQKLRKLAKAHQDAEKDLKKQIQRLRQAGQKAEAEKLEQKLRQLQQQRAQMEWLQDLAKNLGGCAKCLQQGDAQQAADALKQMQAALGDMQKQLDEMEMLDEAMMQIAQAKDQMNCKKCGGQGCAACGGAGFGQNDKWNVGFGLGKGRGAGPRPEEKTDTSSYESRVRPKVGPGAASIVDLVDGPNIPGKVESQIQQQVDSARRGTTDPLSGRQIPRKHGRYAKEYFNKFREGK